MKPIKWKSMGLGPEVKDSTVLIAFSGGPDSVALFHYASHFFKKIILFTHNEWGRLEEEASSDFEEKVKEKAKLIAYRMASVNRELEVEHKFYSIENNEYNSDLTEEQSRNFRYEQIANLTEEFNVDFFLTGHHANDAMETFIMSSFRGTPKLIPFKTVVKNSQGKVAIGFRPFLNISKQNIYDYCSYHKLPYIVDPENYKVGDSFKNERAFFRNEIIPKVQAFNGLNSVSTFQKKYRKMEENGELISHSEKYFKE